MLTVIGDKRTRAIRVMWLLEELGLEYEHLPERPQSDAVRELSSLGKVPLLIDQGRAISDSVAIMTYLADKHAGLTYPAGTIERAQQDSHTFFLLDEFDACLWMAGRHKFALPKEHRVPAVRDSLKWEFARSQKHFVERLGDGPFLMGDKITIPDILAAQCGGWARNSEFPMEEPAFVEYVDRLRARPAFKRAMKK
ncbi:MAG: glutathione S-transferase family protein [Paracoccaceae bacterium]